MNLLLAGAFAIIGVPTLTLVLIAAVPVVVRFQDRFGKAADVDLFAPQEAEGS